MGHIDPVAETGDNDNGKRNEQSQDLIENVLRMARLVSPNKYNIQMCLTVRRIFYTVQITKYVSR